jgi:hypothetical protein
MTQIKRAKQERRSRIPEFASIEEEAAWWDTHDLADYWDEFTPVQVRFAENLSGKILSRGLTIRFDDESLAELRRRAREKGVGPTTLARMWILERLKQP